MTEEKTTFTDIYQADQIPKRPPTKEKIIKRLKDYCSKHPGLPEVEKLLFLKKELLPAIKPLEDNTSNTFREEIFASLPTGVTAVHQIETRYSTHHPVAIAFDTRLASNAVATKIFSEIVDVVALADQKTLFIISDSPTSALWASNENDLLTVIIPCYRGLAESVSLDKARFQGIAEDEGPDGWTEVKNDDDVLIGWKDGNRFAARSNPFMKNNQYESKMSTSSATRRRLLCEEILTAAAGERGKELARLRELREDWNDSYVFATELLDMIVKENSEIYARIREVDREKRQAEHAVVRASEQLDYQQGRLDQAKNNLKEKRKKLAEMPSQKKVVKALEQSISNYVVNNLDSFNDSKNEFLNLPQVADVIEDNQKIWIKTHPLVLNCGAAGKKRLEEVRFSLDLSGRALPEVSSTHPRSDQGNFDWSESALPLAERVSSEEWMPAVAIALGQISATIPVSEDDVEEFEKKNRVLTSVDNDTRIGWQI